jgi:hypothetical protein
MANAAVDVIDLVLRSYMSLVITRSRPRDVIRVDDIEGIHLRTRLCHLTCVKRPRRSCWWQPRLHTTGMIGTARLACSPPTLTVREPLRTGVEA